MRGGNILPLAKNGKVVPHLGIVDTVLNLRKYLLLLLFGLKGVGLYQFTVRTTLVYLLVHNKNTLGVWTGRFKHAHRAGHLLTCLP